MEFWQDKLRREWAGRSPEIDSEWTYWWLEGDEYCLAVVDGNDLAAAIDIVEDHWERYGHIKAYKAKVLDEDLIRKQRSSVEICKRDHAQKTVKDVEAEA